MNQLGRFPQDLLALLKEQRVCLWNLLRQQVSPDVLDFSGVNLR